MKSIININIYSVVGNSICIDPEHGQQVFALITKALNEKKQVTLSFLNVENLATTFLDNAVGQLYKHYSEDFIREKLSVNNISQSAIVALKRTVATAKQYYKDPTAMERSIKEILKNEQPANNTPQPIT